MKASKILFLYNLTLILNWFLANFLILNIFFYDKFLSILISSLIFLFIFNIKNTNLETTLKTVIAIFSVVFVSMLNIPIGFNVFIRIFLFSLFYILSLIVLKSEISNTLSIISIVSFLILYEKLIGIDLIVFTLSILFIIQSLFLKFLKNKTFYFWENNFVLNISSEKRVYKNLISIIIIFSIIFLSISSINLNILNKLTLPNELFFNQNVRQEKENEDIKIKENNLEISTKRYVFKISDFSRKFLTLIFNSFYLIVFLGFFLVLILLGVRFFNLIKAVYGREKSIKFLISSFILSLLIILSVYFLYKPFELLIKSISKNTKIENISIPLLEIVQKLRSFLGSTSTISQKNLPVSIDLGLIFIVTVFVVASTIFLYFLIYYVYSSTLNERKLELNKIIEEFNEDKDSSLEISGSPREKIIKLYNILIKKLSLILLKLDYETPDEYRKKFKREKPELSNEIDLITDNFIISKYSYYEINEDLFYKTFLAFKNLSSKIFKEVYFGREI